MKNSVNFFHAQKRIYLRSRHSFFTKVFTQFPVSQISRIFRIFFSYCFSRRTFARPFYTSFSRIFQSWVAALALHSCPQDRSDLYLLIKPNTLDPYTHAKSHKNEVFGKISAKVSFSGQPTITNAPERPVPSLPQTRLCYCISSMPFQLNAMCCSPSFKF